jgi:putative membrane protein
MRRLGVDRRPVKAEAASLSEQFMPLTRDRRCGRGNRSSTYARVPLGFEIAEALGLHRNPYDKIGHFAQGFVPALAAREILLRGGYIRAGKMLNFLVVCVVLAISASYELIEWRAAVALGQGADEFLGTQGDPWDTQSDMLFALVGAIVALATLAPTQDRQIQRLPPIGAAQQTDPADPG